MLDVVNKARVTVPRTVIQMSVNFTVLGEWSPCSLVVCEKFISPVVALI